MDPKTVSICAPAFNPAYSYGKIAFEVAEELKRRGIWVNYVAGEPDAELPSNDFRLTPYAILMGHPVSFDKYPGGFTFAKSVAVTMWESTVTPEGWDEALNQLAGVVVPCDWVRDVFINNGVEAPMLVSPLGIDSTYKYTSRTCNDRFRYLVIADRGGRKNWIGAGAAFNLAFGMQDMSVELVVKSHNDNTFNVNLIDPNVTQVKQEMSPEEMASLYSSCHALIFPSRAEGFGLPTLEMLATGGVAICADYAGLEWSVKYGAVPIPYSIGPAWRGDTFEGCGSWSEPDIEALAKSLVEVRENYDAYMTISQANAEAIKGRFTWVKFVDDLLEFWRSL